MNVPDITQLRRIITNCFCEKRKKKLHTVLKDKNISMRNESGDQAIDLDGGG